MNIRRPLVWFLVAYVVGMGLYRQRSGTIILIASTIMILSVVWLIHLWRKKKENILPSMFIIGIPVLLILGYLLMNHQELPGSMDGAFQDKIDGFLSGQLVMIEEKENYTILTLKDNTITIEESTEEKSESSHLLQAKKIVKTSRYHSNKLVIYSKSNATYKIGNLLSVTGQIVKFQKASNPGQFNEYQFNKIRNIDYKVNAKSIEIVDAGYSSFYHTLYCIKKRFVEVYSQILPKKDAGIISAMILGEMAFLDRDIKELYQESGISHILAISGLHVTLLGMSLYKLLRKVRMPIPLATAVSISIIVSYGILTNFSVSTNRSVVMIILLMLSIVVGRSYDLLSATSLSALIILIQSPMQVYNCGFLLSFGAILGIALINPIISFAIPLKNKILGALWVSVSIQCMTLPIILYYFYEFPLYSIIINMILVPLSSLIILIAIIAAIIGFISLPFSIFAIGSVHYILDFYELVCLLASKLPGKTVLVGRPNELTMITYYIVILLILILNNKVKRKASILLLPLLLILFVNRKDTSFNVTFLDVGQGDGIFMETPKGTTYLIDGGSSDVKQVGKYRLEPFLKSGGVGEIDYAIVTHTDLDHISGLRELIEEMKTREHKYDGNIIIHHLILPYLVLPDDIYLELVDLAKSKGIQVLYIHKGDIINDDEVTITCLHPDKEFHPTSKNAYSTVLSVSYGEFDLLLTGDLEGEGEERVTNSLKNQIRSQREEIITDYTDYEVLKVAHHGSKFSTTYDFLSIVRPQIAIISCGKNNSYGHPHAELLARLSQIGSKTMITYDCGAVTIKTDGKMLEIVEYINKY